MVLLRSGLILRRYNYHDIIDYRTQKFDCKKEGIENVNSGFDPDCHYRHRNLYLHALCFQKTRDAMNEIDTVRYYHENYLQSRSDKRRQTKHLDKDNGYRTYVTKYNSTEDYRERKGL